MRVCVCVLAIQDKRRRIISDINIHFQYISVPIIYTKSISNNRINLEIEKQMCKLSVNAAESYGVNVNGKFLKVSGVWLQIWTSRSRIICAHLEYMILYSISICIYCFSIYVIITIWYSQWRTLHNIRIAIRYHHSIGMWMEKSV